MRPLYQNQTKILQENYRPISFVSYRHKNFNKIPANLIQQHILKNYWDQIGLSFPGGSEGKESACVQSLGWKDPLEKEMATQSSILAWEIPRTEEPGGLQYMRHKELDTTELLFSRPVMSDPSWPLQMQASLSLTISQSLPKLMFTALVMPSSNLILWRPLLLPSIFPSIGDFSGWACR